MKNIETRNKFWGTIEESGYGGGSEPAPYNKHVQLFKDKNVLEIGAGAGRQFHILKKVAKTYSIADISKLVLDKPMYADTLKFHITSHDMDFGKRFDVVTFWYVVHHVLATELNEFAWFISRHVDTGGYAYFNIPDITQHLFEEDDNSGTITTHHKREDVEGVFVRAGFEVVDVEPLSYDSLNLLCKKIAPPSLTTTPVATPTQP